MLAVPDFADFSQEIGLASLGANAQELKAIAAIYWYTIEFGLCLERGEKRVYGAGILGSLDEIKYALSDEPGHYPLDLFEVAANHHSYPISTVQPYYFVAESFAQSKEQINKYIENNQKAFNVCFDERNSSILIDR